ncbi:hypothetical protein JavanS730_0025 [Streptococcus satellite phage Javan730]|nr:hypothetical protein JavanS730_0025 [Streptococcus satellite phage Javan730]
MLLSFSFAGFWLYVSLRGYAIILPGIKKARLTVLVSCLLNSSFIALLWGFFCGLFENF